MEAVVGDALRVLSCAAKSFLVAPSAWQRLVETGDRIPLTSGGGIECRPDDPDRADFAVRFMSTEAATEALLDSPLAAAGEAGPGLAGLGRHWLREAGRPSGPRMLWLELDLQPGSPPTPSVFAGPGNPPRGRPAGLPDDDEWAAIISLLRPGPPVSGAARLFSVLPRGAWVGYIGIMRGRELRATVSGLKPEEVPDLLRRLAWSGELAALDPVLGVAREHSARITLGLDLNDGIGRALGVELTPFGPDCWEELLDAAATVTPISSLARGALLAWPGENIADANWPDRLRSRAARIVRRLNHLKFGVDGAGRPRLKAYLYFGLID